MYSTLGRTDIRVSQVAMGCWAIVGGGTWGPQDESDAIAAIHAALDSGVTFFDTAEGYGAGYSEQLLRKALGDRRDEVVLGSKISPGHTHSDEDLVAACERSLTNLGTDRIDVYHLHWPNRTRPIGEILAAFDRLRDAGKIRCAAVSNFGPQDLSELLEHGRCEVDQLPYNLLWRAIEYEIVPLCRKHDISVTCYSPIMQGLLTGKFSSVEEVPEGRARTRLFSGERPQARHDGAGYEQEAFAAIRAIGAIARDVGQPMGRVALTWLLQQPGVASVLVGARNAQQMRENAAAMTLRLDADVMTRLDRATQALKTALGSNPDMWQSDSRYR